MTFRRRRHLVLGALLGLVAWTAWGCAVEVYRCGWIRWHDPYPEPSRWRFLSAHVADARDFAAAVREHLPEPASITFTSELDPPEPYFEYLWLSYFLPEHDLHLGAPGDPPATSYWIVRGRRLDAPRLEPLTARGERVLYRVGPGPRIAAAVREARR